jgi:hypothetical protein
VGPFVQAAAEHQLGLPLIAACFYSVRDMPYALDGAHDATGLLHQQRGDCLAKSELMTLAAAEVGIPTRYVRWRYLLPDVVPEIAALPSRIDVHRTVQLHIGGRWVLVDPTHHAALRNTPLVVSDWDGKHDTEPAYPLAGPMMVETIAPEAVSQACKEVRQWTATCPAVLARWRHAYIAWLRQHE